MSKKRDSDVELGLGLGPGLREGRDLTARLSRCLGKDI